MLLIFAFLVLSFVASETIFTRNEDCSEYFKNKNQYHAKSAYHGVGGDCYIVINDIFYYHNAKAACNKLGGDLLSIHDEITNGVAYRINWGAWGWIGLNDKKVEDIWEWEDGKKPSFFNWKPGHPLSGANEAASDAWDCVGFLGGEWVERSCQEGGYAMCHVKGEVNKPFLYNGFDLKGDRIVADVDCPNIGHCGMRDNEVVSLMVPAGWEVILFNDYNFNEKRFIFQGPTRVAQVQTPKSTSSYKVRKIDFETYPSLYKDVDFKGFMFYATTDVYKIAEQFSGGDNAISSFKVPGGWQITLYEHNGYGGRSRTFYGPIDVPDISVYTSQLSDVVSAFKIAPNSKAIFKVTDIFFDRAKTIEEKTDTLENMVLKNPTSTTQEVVLGKEYSNTQETNWFTQHTFKVTFEYENTVTTDTKVVETEEKWKWGFENENTWNKGGSSSSTVTKKYDFKCIAEPYTTTSCVVHQVHGKYAIPYKGELIFTYPSGEIGIQDYESTMITDVGGKAFVSVTPTNRKFGARIYDTVVAKANQKFTFDMAKLECYRMGMDIVEIESKAENRFVQKLCHDKSFFLDGYALADKKPKWKRSQSVFTWWLRAVDVSKFGRTDHRIVVSTSQFGYWDLQDMNKGGVGCAACSTLAAPHKAK